jgi:hypothetical protein
MLHIIIPVHSDSEVQLEKMKESARKEQRRATRINKCAKSKYGMTLREDAKHCWNLAMVTQYWQDKHRVDNSISMV